MPDTNDVADRAASPRAENENPPIRAAGPDELDPGLREVGDLVRTTRLRNVLRVNAVVSGLTGITMLAGAGPLADVLGVAALPVRGLGLGLVAFASVVAVVSCVSRPGLPRLTAAIAAADGIWVLGSILAIGLGAFTPAGNVLVAGAAVVVATFAWLETSGVRHLAGRTSPQATGNPPMEAIQVSRRLRTSAERAWTVVTDHELYGRLAPNLSRVEPTTSDGPGLARRCYDGSGRGWNETCTLWDEGRRFAVEVDTSDYPYPLTVMRGSWWVEPAGAGHARVGMTFALRPTTGLRGRTFVWLMHAAFPFVLKRILRGWQRAAES